MWERLNARLAQLVAQGAYDEAQGAGWRCGACVLWHRVGGAKAMWADWKVAG